MNVLVSFPDPKQIPAQIAFSIRMIYAPDEIWGQDYECVYNHLRWKSRLMTQHDTLFPIFQSDVQMSLYADVCHYSFTTVTVYIILHVTIFPIPYTVSLHVSSNPRCPRQFSALCCPQTHVCCHGNIDVCTWEGGASLPETPDKQLSACGQVVRAFNFR